MNTLVFGAGLFGLLAVFGAIYIKSYYFVKPYLLSLAGDWAETAEMILDASIFAEIGLFFLLLFSMKQAK